MVLYIRATQVPAYVQEPRLPDNRSRTELAELPRPLLRKALFGMSCLGVVTQVEGGLRDEEGIVQ